MVQILTESKESISLLKNFFGELFGNIGTDVTVECMTSS